MSFSTEGETDPPEEIVPDDRTPADLHPTIPATLQSLVNPSLGVRE